MDIAQFLSQFTRLLSVPPGDLVYYLIVFFAIWAILMMAMDEGRYSNWKSSTVRVVLAAGGLLTARCALVIVALLSAAGIANPAWIAPPLERLVAVVSLGLLAWAFLPLLDDYPQAGLVLVVVNTLAGVILYAVFAPQWYEESLQAGASFNTTLADWVWNIWAAAVASLAIVAALVRRRAQWGMLVAIFTLLLGGHLLHLFTAEAQSHVAGWVRLAELSAYPLLAGLMIRRAIEREEPAPPPVVTAPWTVIEACQRVADASNVNVALQRAGVAISNVLGADVLAIGLLNESSDTVELAAVCRVGAPARSGPAFDLDSQLPIQSAVSRQRALMVDADHEAQRATLAALVGGTAGPLWVQPLIHQRVTMGVLIIGRPHAAIGWTASEAQTLGGLCSVLAAALSVARKAAALARQVDELTQIARDRETALAQAQAEARQWSTQLAQAEAQRRSVPSTFAPRGTTRPPETMPPARSAPPSDKQPLADSAHTESFFDEADKRVQRLNDLRDSLAASPNDSNTLFELFRAAQSLKEMAAKLGYNTLAKLATALSDALRSAKDNDQPVTLNLLALVGESASALRILLADARAARSPSVDITPLLIRLMAPAPPSPLAKSKESAGGTPSPERKLVARVQLDHNTSLKTARATMVLSQIKRVGQIVACQPVEADLRSGGFEDEFAVTFTTSSAPEAVRAALAAIRDVTNVDVSQIVQ
jgi:HPt (histidine-containing phosphotransfer) domain-containing protein